MPYNSSALGMSFCAKAPLIGWKWNRSSWPLSIIYHQIRSKYRQLPVRRTTCLFIMILPCVTISYQCSIAMLLEATQHPPTLGAFGSILHLFTKPQLRRLLDRLVVEHVGMAVVGVGIPGGTPHGRPRTSEVSQKC